MIAGAAAGLVLTTPFAAADAAEHKTGGHSAHAGKSVSHASRRHSKMASASGSRGANVRHASNGHRGGRGDGLVGLAVGAALSGSSGSCGFSYRMWQSTGGSYWRSRYYDCAG